MKNNKTISLYMSIILVISIGCHNAPEKPAIEKPATAVSPDSDIQNEIALETKKMNSFGDRYAKAWSSQQPDHVAAYFSPTGSLKVNDSKPAVGKEAIAKVAEGFMKAFPDMIVTKDSMKVTGYGIEFHWTLTGTNTGPKGTGKKVKISGFESWQMSNEGLIQVSIGNFDAKEYNRQLKYGVAN
jgi:SnoaL-like polyketide cyclase